MSLFRGFLNSFGHCVRAKSFFRHMSMFCICFTRASRLQVESSGHPKKSLKKHLCSGLRFIRSNQGSKNHIERTLRRFISKTCHNARVTTQVSFLKSKSQASNYQSPSGNLFSESITQEMSWVNTEDSPI